MPNQWNHETSSYTSSYTSLKESNYFISLQQNYSLFVIFPCHPVMYKISFLSLDDSCPFIQLLYAHTSDKWETRNRSSWKPGANCHKLHDKVPTFIVVLESREMLDIWLSSFVLCVLLIILPNTRMAEIRFTRNLFLRCMNVIYLFAFASLYIQIPGKCNGLEFRQGLHSSSVELKLYHRFSQSWFIT